MKKAEEDVLKELVSIASLLKKAWKTKDWLCDNFGLEPKTLERRLSRIREIEKDYFLICDRTRGYKLIPLDGLKKEKSIKEKILPLDGNEDLYETETHKKIRLLQEAIDRKVWVRIKDYIPANNQPQSDRTLLPLMLVLSGVPRIIAIDDEEKQKKKTFNLERMGEILVLKTKSKVSIDLSRIRFDDFGLLYEEGDKLNKVTLLLTSYSRSMIARDFPAFKPRIEHLPFKEPISKEIKGEKYQYHYKLELKICHIGALGRMVCGMLDNIIVKEAEEDVRVALREFVKKTVFDAFEFNL